MKDPKEGMTYATSGVDYGPLDKLKREAQAAASLTDRHVERFGFKVVAWTRGESAFLVETPIGYLGFVVEGLGTKSLVADQYQVAANIDLATGRSFYDSIAVCNAAMAFNDLITLGALPFAYGQYLALQSAEWCTNDRVRSDLINGTKKACDMARCTWGGGETPVLNGIINPNTADLAGATMGIINPKEWLINPANIRPGDSIVIIGSSGIHANGLSMARKLAANLPKGYLTELPDGRTYGETLLDETLIYVNIIETCLINEVDIHYTVNITGHGWRKFMRATQPFTYVIEKLPKQLPIFDFIQQHGSVTDVEMYQTFNMGAGFALYVPPAVAEKVISIAQLYGFDAFVAGYIMDGEKQVIIEEKKLAYAADTLAVR